MPWSKDKIRRELDKGRLVKGLLDVRLELSKELLEENILDLFENGSPTDRQVINGMWLLHDQAYRSTSDLSPAKVLELMERYIQRVKNRKELGVLTLQFCIKMATYDGKFLAPRLPSTLDLLSKHCPEVLVDEVHVVDSIKRQMETHNK